MDSELKTPSDGEQLTDNRSIYQKNWEELSESQRDALVKKYGEPITIQGASLEELGEAVSKAAEVIPAVNIDNKNPKPKIAVFLITFFQS